MESATRAITESGTWWLMSTMFVVGIGCLAGRLVQWLRSPSREPTSLLVVASLFSGALAVRVLLPPWTHYTYNDEYLYLRYASELASTGSFTFPSQPPLLIYVYAVAFRVFGGSAYTSFVLTSLAGSLTVAALYGCLRSLGVERTVALLAAALLALHPLHVKHSGASSLEVMSLLFLVSAIGTFAQWLRGPGLLGLLSFATCLFGALTTRVENFALLPVLAGLGYLPDLRKRRPATGELAVLAAVVVLAALYLPAVLGFHGEQAGWWKSELGAGTLFWNNLAFWIGGSLTIGKVPLLLMVGGIVGSFFSARPACLTWLAVFVTYSVVYVVHGVNLGYHPESAHPAYFAAREGGHDMFRFNVTLLPAMVFFAASGVVAWIRLVDLTLARLSVRASPIGSGVIVTAVGLLLLGIGGEYRAYDPVAFLHSSYNRPIERAEYEFLEANLAGHPPPVRCYRFRTSTDPYLGDGVEVVLADDADQIRVGGGTTFLYVNSAQLRIPAMRASFEQLRTRFDLESVAAERVGPLELRLYRIRTR